MKNIEGRGYIILYENDDGQLDFISGVADKKYHDGILNMVKSNTLDNILFSYFGNMTGKQSDLLYSQITPLIGTPFKEISDEVNTLVEKLKQLGAD